MVYIPLIGGIALFALFLVWESRYKHAMLDLSLFRIRNFAITNVETLIVYAGLIGAFFFLTLFLQQTAGYSPLAAGFATTPTSLLLFFLSPRFGRIATSTGPRVPMCVGPIIGGIGLLLLTRVTADADYLTEVLPGVLVFGLGLSITVAPLTATALNSVEQRHAGVASGINNGVSRMAGLLGIAVLGALIAGQFGSSGRRGRRRGEPVAGRGHRDRGGQEQSARPAGHRRAAAGRGRARWTPRPPTARSRPSTGDGRQRRADDHRRNRGRHRASKSQAGAGADRATGRARRRVRAQRRGDGSRSFGLSLFL